MISRIDSRPLPQVPELDEKTLDFINNLVSELEDPNGELCNKIQYNKKIEEECLTECMYHNCLY